MLTDRVNNFPTMMKFLVQATLILGTLPILFWQAAVLKSDKKKSEGILHLLIKLRV